MRLPLWALATLIAGSALALPLPRETKFGGDVGLVPRGSGEDNVDSSPLLGSSYGPIRTHRRGQHRVSKPYSSQPGSSKTYISHSDTRRLPAQEYTMQTERHDPAEYYRSDRFSVPTASSSSTEQHQNDINIGNSETDSPPYRITLPPFSSISSFSSGADHWEQFDTSSTNSPRRPPTPPPRLREKAPQSSPSPDLYSPTTPPHETPSAITPPSASLIAASHGAPPLSQEAPTRRPFREIRREIQHRPPYHDPEQQAATRPINRGQANQQRTFQPTTTHHQAIPPQLRQLFTTLTPARPAGPPTQVQTHGPPQADPPQHAAPSGVRPVIVAGRPIFQHHHAIVHSSQLASLKLQPGLYQLVPLPVFTPVKRTQKLNNEQLIAHLEQHLAERRTYPPNTSSAPSQNPPLHQVPNPPSQQQARLNPTKPAPKPAADDGRQTQYNPQPNAAAGPSNQMYAPPLKNPHQRSGKPPAWMPNQPYDPRNGPPSQ